MPTFDDGLDEILDDEFYTSEYAHDATYNDVPIKLIEDGQFERVEHFPGFKTASASVQVRESEIAAPEVGDKVVWKDLIWRVGANPDLKGGEWQLTLHRDDVSVSV